MAIAIAGSVSCLALAVPSVQAADATPVQRAVAWLATQQQPDGGFEVAAFPGFETPDATFAIAASAQGAKWDVCAARTAVLNVKNAQGKTALDALDTLAETQGDDVGIAAKLIVLVALPLGLDPYDFDPSNNSAAPVNLMATVQAAAGPSGSVKAGALNATAYATIALAAGQGVIYGPMIGYLTSTQRADGSWNYAGSLVDDGDVDTTATVLQALLSVGFKPTDAALAKGYGYLARAHNADGSWSSFGSPDPNSTSTATMAIRAGGFDPSSSVWRNAFAPELTGSVYGSPYMFLVDQQQPDGRIASPNDGYGVNTFATSQAIEALAGAKLPEGFPNGTCIAPPTTTAPAGAGNGGVIVVVRPNPAASTTASSSTTSTSSTTAPRVAGTSVSTSPTTPSATLPKASKGSNSGLETAVAVGIGVALLATAGFVLARRRRIPGS